MAISSGLFAQNNLKTVLCTNDGWVLIINEKQTLNPKTNSYYYKITSNYLESLSLKTPKTDKKTFIFNSDGTFAWSANASCGNTFPHGGTGKWGLSEGEKSTITLTFDVAPEGWSNNKISYIIKSATSEKIDFEIQKRK